MKIKPLHILLTLSILFLAYSISIYVEPMRESSTHSFNTKKALEGRLVWQKYNCHTCHQLYNLGGYLGPDLTNVYSKYKGDTSILKAFFNGGIRQMPIFEMTEKEKDLLIEFLKSTDASGSADPRKLKPLSNGMTQPYGR